MRPRVFPAEDASSTLARMLPGSRFNEAAGIPRGRRREEPPTAHPRAGFNEAAGIPRGRLGPVRYLATSERLLQ